MFIFFYRKISFRKDDLIAAFYLGIFNFLAFSLQTFGLKYALSSVVAFITGAYIMFVPIFSYFLFKKRVSIEAIIGVFLAIIGLYLLSVKGDIAISKGEVLVFIGTIFIALHIIYTDFFVKKYNFYTLVTFQFFFIAIFAFVFTFFEKKDNIISENVIIALIITVIFATIFAYYVQTAVQRFLSPTKTALIFALEPLSAAIFGYFCGEVLSLKQLIGGVILILAIVISELDLIKK